MATTSTTWSANTSKMIEEMKKERERELNTLMVIGNRQIRQSTWRNQTYSKKKREKGEKV